MSKIIFFEYIHHLGGAQLSSIDVISNLRNIGNDVYVIDPVGKIDNFKKLVELSGAKYISFGRDFNFKQKNNLKGCIALLYYILDILSLIYYIIKIRPNIIFTSSLKALIPILIGKIFYRYKKFFYLRGITDQPFSFLKKIIFRKLIDLIFVQANQIKLYLIENGINKNQIKIIPNAISNIFLNPKFTPELNIAQFQTRKIAIISSIIPTKGYNELIIACCKLKKLNSDFKLFIVGNFLDEQYESFIRNLIFEHGLCEQIVFLGYRTDIGNILEAIDIFVLPSYAEGTPRSILEAMALGKAVIASNVGGISDCIIDGKTGLLVSAKDSEELANSLLKLIKDIDLATKIGKNAKKFVRTNFTMENQKQLLSKKFI